MGMEGLLSALVSVAVMLAYAVPGFALVKYKAVSADSISAFAKVLMVLCAPCLAVYAFTSVPFSWALLGNIGIFFGLCSAVMLVTLTVVALLFYKKSGDVRYRVSTVAAAFGNVSFMGLPLLNALFPEHPEVMVYSIAFFTAMSVLGWSVGSYLITRKKRFISVKKILLNPGVLALVVALPLFCCSVKLPAAVSDVFTVLGKMTTPLCMLVMGMRLATLPFKPLVADPLQYAVVAVKQIAVPLLSMLAFLLPIDPVLKAALFVCCCCPVASVVLNFTEMLGEGQQTAANEVLLGTLMSVVTIPLMLLLL